MLNDWSQLKGHDEQRELFRRSLKRNRLSHAYALVGPEGIGKLQFARLLAQSCFCQKRDFDQLEVCGDCRACRGFAVGSWPDYTEIGVPEGKSEIPIALLAGSPEKRGREGLCYELSMSPQASDRRVAVINDAGQMNTESANALLKTLEEPPSQALILLVCDQPESLLPTIRSRCQLVRFFPLTDSEVAAIILQQELVESEEEAARIAQLSGGSLETARQLLSPELRSLRDTVAAEISRLDGMKPLELASRVTSGIEEISSNTSEQRQNAQWLLKFVADALQARLRGLCSGDLSDPLTERLGVRLGIDLLAPMVDRTVTAAAQISGSSPVKLVMEALFDEVAQMMRRGLARR
jgi:DNA polymerase-3 subunit delta'